MPSSASLEKETCQGAAPAKLQTCCRSQLCNSSIALIWMLGREPCTAAEITLSESHCKSFHMVCKKKKKKRGSKEDTFLYSETSIHFIRSKVEEFSMHPSLFLIHPSILLSVSRNMLQVSSLVLDVPDEETSEDKVWNGAELTGRGYITLVIASAGRIKSHILATLGQHLDCTPLASDFLF